MLHHLVKFTFKGR